jgi:recombination protein RecA
MIQTHLLLSFYDSLAVSPSKAEMSAEGYEGNNMQGATRAKTIGAALRKINPILRPLKVALILVNQIRTKVGVMFGDPRTSAAGGNAWTTTWVLTLELPSLRT